MEIWKIMLSVAGVLTPVILAAFARDRSLLTMITDTKHDVGEQVKTAADAVHERINRVRDEYVRRDDLDGHLKRIEKQMDDLRAELRRRDDKFDESLSEISKLLQRK